MRTSRGWRIVVGVAGVALVGGVLSIAQEAIPPGQPAAPAGVEVLARGPVHEAFAESVAGTPGASPVVPKQPPQPIDELPPDQKPEGENICWIPGYWSWDEERKDHIWISGFWRSPPPGRQWTPGHWKDAEGGWQWAPGFWAAVPTNPQAEQQVTYLAPPPPPAQTAPSTPAPGPDYTFVPGCWVWSDGRYVWRPGCWIACRPNWVWVPAHYVWTPCGYVFVEGYWDYTLRDRGLLFAPVYVSASMYGQPGYCYTPAYAIQDQSLYGAMFVRPGYTTYYFGDYFGAPYRGGYVAWCDYQVGYYRDPLFTYYSYQYRNDPGWSVSIRAGYVGIYAGNIAPPPRTLIQQTTIVQNTVINKTVVNNTTIVNNNTNVVNNVRTTTMVTSLNQVQSVKLQPVSMEARQAHQQAARQVVQASAVRSRTEAQVLAKGPPPTKPTDPPRTAAMNMPRTPSAPASHAATPAATHPSTSATPQSHSPTATPAAHPTTGPAGGSHPAAKSPPPANHQAPPAKRPPPPPAHKSENKPNDH